MVSVITTTINKPILLKDYCENAKKFGHSEINFIVIGDKKTPKDVGRFCLELQRKCGYKVSYYDIKEQLEFLRGFKKLKDHLPFNSIQRRNIGLLKAYLDGSEVIITIDDDNFVLRDQDFIGKHSIVGKEKEFISLSSSSGWYNVCEMLEEERGLPFYARGFPLSKRWQEQKVTVKKKKGKIVVNAGLWLEAPDIDALTWLDLPIKVKRFSSKYYNGVGLDIGTWSPFNSQNTALAREVIPAYFLSPYIGRYDDIWASYVVKKITDHLGHFIHFGLPLVRQERNPHNYFVDFDKERFGMEVTDEFLNNLDLVRLTGRDYSECFEEIKIFLKQNKKGEQPFNNLINGIEIWNKIHW